MASTEMNQSPMDDARFGASWGVFICAMALVVIIGFAGIFLFVAFWGPWVVGTGLALIGLSIVTGWLVFQSAPRRDALLVVDRDGIHASLRGRFVPWQSVRTVRPRVNLGGITLEIAFDKDRVSDADADDTRVPLGHVHGSPRAVASALAKFAPAGVSVDTPHHGWVHRLPTFALWVWVFMCFGLAALSEGGGSMAAMHNLIGNMLYKGIIVEQDKEAAVEHYRKAAENGSAQSRMTLDYLRDHQPRSPGT